MYLVKTPSILKQIYPASLIWNMPRDGNKLYLTFDDGPVPGVTPWVLETLERYRAKASFFCIGDNVRKHPEVYRQVLAAKHSVGNHTFHHLNGWKNEDEQYLENIRKCSHLVSSELFRPPYGRIKRSQIRRLREATAGAGATAPALPSRIIMWDVLSGDFDTSLSPEKCLRNVLKHAENGSIIVFHDSLKAEKRLRHALPRALETWKEMGFQFERLSF